MGLDLGDDKASKGSSVVCLLFWRRPSKIIRSIWAVRVRPAIYCVLRRWRLSDVSDECFKGIPPAIADRNAKRSVDTMLVMLGAVATAVHGPPRGMQGVISHRRIILAQNGDAFARRSSPGERVAVVVPGAFVVLFAEATRFVALAAALDRTQSRGSHVNLLQLG